MKTSSILDPFLLAFAALYLAAAGVNLLIPIGAFAAVVLLLLALGVVYASWSSAHSRWFGEHRATLAGVAAVYVPWSVAALMRAAVDVDANVYHLPTSLLINHSVWYPGIGRISTHMAFPNGGSLLAAVPSALGSAGLANGINLVFLALLFLSVYERLDEKGLSRRWALLLALTFALTPVFFWQGYNMGADLPQACLLFVGLSALLGGRNDRALFAFGLAGVFKPLGYLAFFATAACLALRDPRNRTGWLSPRSALGLALVGASLLRTWIATGNPVYPVYPLELAAWAYPVGQQQIVLDTIRQYAAFPRTLDGALGYAWDFLFRPYLAHSRYWFSPMFVAWGFLGAGIAFRTRHERAPGRYLAHGMAALLAVVWLVGSPMFRQGAGLFLFWTCESIIALYPSLSRPLSRRLVMAPALLCLAVFGWNAVRYTARVLLPGARSSARNAELLPYGQDIFTPSRSAAGVAFTRSSSTYCGRSPPPCLGRHALGDAEDILAVYARYNHLAATDASDPQQSAEDRR